MRVLFFILFFGIISCTAVTDSSDDQTKTLFVGIRDGKLLYEGTITESANNAIFDAYKKTENKPDRLLISSDGGAVELGIELANWVRMHNLDVEVTNLCASSCANYVFPSGNRKYLRKDSILLWHGSAWQSNWKVDDAFKDYFSKYLISLRKKETSFFSKVEVDNLICTYGQSKINFWDHLLTIFGGTIEGYDYSLADMKRFGLSNILLIDNEWDWRKYKPNNSGRIKRIQVSDDYRFKLRRFEI